MAWTCCCHVQGLVVLVPFFFLKAEAWLRPRLSLTMSVINISRAAVPSTTGIVFELGIHASLQVSLCAFQDTALCQN